VKFYLFGHGSIGSRHLKNLTELGHQETTSQAEADGFLICNPTAYHLETALKITRYNKPIFIEKPISHNLNGLDKLTGKILVGYCLRFDQSLKFFKQKIAGKKIIKVTIVCRSWLPDWHPDKDYRQSYSAKKDLGGGVLLDLSHEIDYALWFFGPVKKVTAKLQMAPELQIETESIADLNLDFVSGVNAEVHLSYASRQPTRFCEIKTSDQLLRWDFQPNNEMYLEEMKHFVRIIEGKEQPLVTIADGIKVLKIIETAKINQL